MSKYRFMRILFLPISIGNWACNNLSKNLIETGKNTVQVKPSDDSKTRDDGDSSNDKLIDESEDNSKSSNDSTSSDNFNQGNKENGADTYEKIIRESEVDCNLVKSEGLQKNPSRYEVACFNSVDEFIAALPLDTRKRYSLVHTSKSRQSLYTTLENPRMLLHSRYGETLFGISTHPDDPNREEIEFAQLNEDSGIWDFFAIDFSKDDQKISDGKNCTGCHGPAIDNLAPIWKEYHLWPNAYSGGEPGKMDECRSGNRALTEEQAANLNRIVAGKNSSDRFKHIEFSRDGGYEKCHHLSIPGGPINLAFTRELNTSQVKAAMIKMKQSPHYKKHRFTLILEGDLCRKHNWEDTNEILTKLKNDRDSYYVQRYENQNLGSWLKTTEVLGIDTRTNFQFQEPFSENGQFNEAAVGMAYNAGRYDITIFIQYLVMYELAKEFPEELKDLLKMQTNIDILQKFYVKHTGSRDNIRPGDHVKRFQGSGDLCAAIGKIATREVPNYN